MHPLNKLQHSHSNARNSLQRYSQSSVLKRTALQLIAEDMLSHAAQGVPPETACPLSSGARPILTHPRHSPMQALFRSMQFGSPDGASVTRGQMTSELQVLGESACSVSWLVSLRRGGGGLQLMDRVSEWQIEIVDERVQSFGCCATTIQPLHPTH